MFAKAMYNILLISSVKNKTEQRKKQRVIIMKEKQAAKTSQISAAKYLFQVYCSLLFVFCFQIPQSTLYYILAHPNLLTVLSYRLCENHTA